MQTSKPGGAGAAFSNGQKNKRVQAQDRCLSRRAWELDGSGVGRGPAGSMDWTAWRHGQDSMALMYSVAGTMSHTPGGDEARAEVAERWVCMSWAKQAA